MKKYKTVREFIETVNPTSEQLEAFELFGVIKINDVIHLHDPFEII